MKNFYKLQSNVQITVHPFRVLRQLSTFLLILLQFNISEAQELNTLPDGSYYIKKPGTDLYLTVQPAPDRSMVFLPLSEADRATQRFIFTKDIDAGGRYKVEAENPLGHNNYWSEWGEFLWADETYTPANHANNVFKNGNNKYALRGNAPEVAGTFYGVRANNMILFRGGANEITPPSFPFELIPYTAAKAEQIIIFPELAVKGNGAADFSPGATATSELPVTYTSSNPGVATIVGGNIHIVAPGAALITATQAGDAANNPAVLSRVLTVKSPANSLIAHYKFDNSLADQKGAYNGLAFGAPSYVAGKEGNAADLNGTTDFLVLPDGIASDLDSFTVATFVRRDASGWMERIFDFGDNSTNWMFLSTYPGNNKLRYSVKLKDGPDQELTTDTESDITGEWRHVALTFSNGVAKIFVDGAEVPSSVTAGGSITAKPSDLGFTLQNMIGRSQWNGDAKFNGAFDDYRIYNYPLSQAQIAALSSGEALPVSLTNYTVWLQPDGNVALNWVTVSETNNRSFSVERSVDGINFVVIGTVDAKSAAGASYLFTDSHPVTGISYYRLVQTDKDGGKKYLGIRNISLGGKAKLSVFPNPVKGNSITFTVTEPLDGKLGVRITDMAGRAMVSKVLAATATGIYTMPLTLAEGVYILSVNGSSTRLVKQ